MIKILALISLYPLLYIINKIRRRGDLNIFDVVICSFSLYMGLIPLFGDESDIIYRDVRNDVFINLMTYLIYFTFISFMMILAICQSKNKSVNNIYNVTKFLRNRIANTVVDTSLLIQLLLCCSFLAYALYNDNNIDFLELSENSMEGIRELQEANKSSFRMIIQSSSHSVRLYAVYLLVCIYLKYKYGLISLRKSYKWIMYGCLGYVIIFHLFISRTYLIESITFGSLNIYACLKEKITKIIMVKFSIVLLFSIMIIFPAISAFRLIRTDAIHNKVNTDLFSLVNLGFESLKRGDIDFSTSDNKSSRAWGVYQIIPHSIGSSYEGNGELFLTSLSSGIPKAIYPGKSKIGSQTIIENKVSGGVDIADSFLLYGVLENRLLSPFLALLCYIFVFWIFKTINVILLNLFNNKYCSIYILCVIYIHAFRVEQTIDSILPATIQTVIFVVCFNYVTKSCLYFGRKKL